MGSTRYNRAMSATQTSTVLWHPKHWPSWFGLGLLQLLCLLPARMQRAIGTGLGHLVRPILPSRNKIIETNLAIAFPELDDAERRKLRNEHYANIGIGAFELGMAWWWSPKRLSGLADIEGLEHLQAARDAGEGLIVLSGHYTTLEICTRLLSDKIKMSAMYAPTRNAVLAWAMRHYRNQHASSILSQDDVRGMVRGLRNGEFVWYAPDQSRRTPFSELAEFFGKPAWTISAIGRLAKMGRAKVVAFDGYRKADGRYQLRIRPVADRLPSEDSKTDALAMNQLIEDGVRHAPAQYFWIHRRWKDRDGGTGYPYGDM